jgi:hypothetical protein
MRRLSLALLTLALLASPLAVRAGGFHVEGSVGSGVRTGVGDAARIPTNLMATLGYGFTDMIKLQVGAVANLGDVSASYSAGGSKFDVDLRGMLVVAPPLFPLYLRGIAGVTSLKSKPARFTWGGALGMSFGLLGVGVFGEVGAMQRAYQMADPVTAIETEKMGLQVEGRIGVSIG